MNQERLIRSGLSWLGRIVLGVAFIYAALWKLKSPQDFADNIAAYQLLPPLAVNVFAMGLPVFELVCGLLVLSGFYVRVGALGISSLLLFFGGALTLSQIRGLKIDCGCFGAHSWLDGTPWMAFARDGILLLLALMIYRFAVESSAQSNLARSDR